MRVSESDNSDWVGPRSKRHAERKQNMACILKRAPRERDSLSQAVFLEASFWGQKGGFKGLKQACFYGYRSYYTWLLRSDPQPPKEDQ